MTQSGRLQEPVSATEDADCFLPLELRSEGSLYEWTDWAQSRPPNAHARPRYGNWPLGRKTNRSGRQCMLSFCQHLKMSLAVKSSSRVGLRQSVSRSRALVALPLRSRRALEAKALLGPDGKPGKLLSSGRVGKSTLGRLSHTNAWLAPGCWNRKSHYSFAIDLVGCTPAAR